MADLADVADLPDVAPDGRPLRVLWLIKGLGPGGAEQLLVNQARVRDRDRFEFEAAYLVPWKNHLVPVLEDLGVGVTCLDAPRELDPRWALRLRALLVRGRFDVVHVHSPYVAGVLRLVAQTLPRSRRPVLVYTEHNQWPRHAPPTRLLNRLTMPLDDFDIAVSDDVRSTMTPALAERTRVLVHGVDPTLVRSHLSEREAVRAELGFTDEQIVIGIVANFRREKAYEVWLNAVRFALDTDRDLRFVSVGQGPLEDDMRRLHHELGLDDRVQLLGYREDALRVMTAFDVFTLTSRHEGLPVTVMDALALGLPVVATDVGGIPEAIDHDVEGLLYESGNARALAKAYVTLAADAPLRSRLAAAALARSTDFDVEVTQRRLELTYRRLVDKYRS